MPGVLRDVQWRAVVVGDGGLLVNARRHARARFVRGSAQGWMWMGPEHVVKRYRGRLWVTMTRKAFEAKLQAQAGQRIRWSAPTENPADVGIAHWP